MAFPFQVKVVRTRRKRTAAISVSDDTVKITVPSTLSDNRIRELITKRTPWIKKQLQEQLDRPKPKAKEYAHGETFAYLGKHYQLKVLTGVASSIKLKGGYFEVTLRKIDHNSKSTIRRLLTEWYKDHAKKRLMDKTKRFAKIIGVVPNSITVKDYKSRWGSCSTQGDISYNWRIILAPDNIVDYVVVHELCHILEHNHSSRYWQHVTRYMPNWRECRDWLKQRRIVIEMYTTC